MEPITVNPKMIVLAREFRGIQQEELAKKIGITQSFLSKIEKGLLQLNLDVFDKLHSYLKFDAKFFTKRGDVFPPNLYYRKKTKTSQKVLDKAEAVMNVFRLSVQELLDSIDIDVKPLPNFDLDEHDSPKIVAKKVRQMWGIPSGPLSNLFEVIEKRGVIIIHCNFDSLDIDGRSMFTDNKQPIIFLNRSIPVCRQRFTAAHELGHLLMHVNNSVPDNRSTENEANMFASEFLLPEADLKKQISRTITLSDLADLKRYWKVSMQAILYKAGESKLISGYNHRNLFIDINRHGFRLREPIELEPPKEKPVILNTLINLHLNDLEFSENELSSVLGIQFGEFKDMYMDVEHKKMRIVI